MKKFRHSKPMALLVALLLLFQLLPMATVLAAGEKEISTYAAEDGVEESIDLGVEGIVPFASGIGTSTITDITNTKYLNIHSKTHATLPTTIEIKSGSTIYNPVNGVYENIPTNATLKLTLGFDLSDGDGENIFEYDGNEFFNFQLPQGITFNPISGIAIKDGSGTQIATGTISGNILKVEFNSAIKDKTGIWGFVEINGVFDSMASGSPEETSFKIGEEWITIKRNPNDPAPPEGEVNLDKNGTYDPFNNVILWAVTVTPSAGQNIGGWKVVDTYSANQSYVTDSFTITPVPTPSVSPILGENTITYVFPAGTTGTQVITYKTNPGTPFDYATEFKNTANLKDAADVSKKTVTKTVTLGGLIKKEGSDISPDDKGIIDWTVTVKLPKASDGSTPLLPNAKIIDTMSEKLTLDISKQVQISFDGSSFSTVSVGTGDSTYDFIGNILTYRFPTNEPHAGDTAVLKYSTKVLNWDSSMTGNSGVTFTNNAVFTWNYDSNGDGTGDTGITIGTGDVSKTAGSGGLVSKSLAGG